MVQYSTMESRNHSKNAASLKSLTSKVNFPIKSFWPIGIFAVLSTLFYSCASMMGAAAPEEARRYERVVEVPNHTKSEIYVKANAWFVETFNSAESVIEFQDRESGRIMGKYVFTYNEGVYTHAVRQTISLDCRDNRVRIVINDPYFKTTHGMGQYYPNAQYSPLKTQAGVDKAKIRWEDLSNSLEKYLQTDDSW